MFGICAQPVDKFNAYPFFFKEIDVIGTRALTGADYEPTMKLVASQAVNLKPLITRRFPLEKIKEALDFVEKSQSDVLRVVVGS